jgi:shikimate kinase
MTKTNVVLIGMAGAGKSTVGVVLAKRLGLDFLDTDVLIQARQGRRLQEIIDTEGLAAFRQIEETTLLSLSCRRTVIATGGSAIYSEAGMAALKTYGTIVFLDTPLEELLLRIRDMDTRGMVIDPGETFPDLFARRLPLYRQWAELIVDGRGKSVEELAADIADRLQDHLPTPA